MNVIDIFQYATTASIVLIGIMYIIGGLIVNLNLSRRGVVEFQILKVKYLVVGLVFLLHSTGVFVFAALPAFGLLFVSNYTSTFPVFIHIFISTSSDFLQLTNLLSMAASASLILIWARMPTGSNSYLTKWNYWFLASTIGAIFPMMVLIRQLLSPSIEIVWLILSGQAMLTAALVFLSQVYHYSAFYYGRPSQLGALDPIGVGIPSRVRVACTSEQARLLKGLGITFRKDGVSQDIFLVDETDHHYILGFERIPTQQGDDRTIKVDKELVKAILFIPDHMRPIGKKNNENQ